MATTDLHMQLLAFNYFRGRNAPHVDRGLERLAALIAQHRSAVSNSLLFDNGDLLQGNPLADHLATAPRSRRTAHPAIVSLNALGFDAATLGNHDFSFGTSFLAWALAGARFPVVVANARLPGLHDVLRTWVILHRQLRDRTGTLHPFSIGVIGFVPPQTAAWEAAAVPALRTEDIIDVAAREVPRMRAAGATVVIALAHAGVSPPPHRNGNENAAATLAAMPGIDAVIAGHTHDVIPPPGAQAVHTQPGPAPLVQAGFGGSHLGVIDLVLRQGPYGRGWRIAQATAQVQAAATADVDGPQAAQSMAAVRQASWPVHQAALRAASRRIGRTAVPLRSDLAMLGQDAGLRLVAMAQRWHLRASLAGTAYAGLPILAAVSPFRAGGLGGPGHFTRINVGRVTHGDLTDLYPFNNLAAAILITGAELVDWLERAAGAFAHITPEIPEQELIDPDFPSYNFDMIDGLHWQIDLSQPARYAPDGFARSTDGRRVRGLTHAGQAVAPDQRFVLATHGYRLSGIGLYSDLTADRRPISQSDQRLRDLVRAYLHRRRVVAPKSQGMFTFARVPGASAILRTSPDAASLLTHDPLGAIADGIDASGFLRLRVPLDRA